VRGSSNLDARNMVTSVGASIVCAPFVALQM